MGAGETKDEDEGKGSGGKLKEVMEEVWCGVCL